MAATTITSSDGGLGLVKPLVFNAGSVIPVGYVADEALTAGNIFSVELSDENGDFPGTIIGTKTDTAISGTIDSNIPVRVIESGFYRIRVLSSNPVITGTSNGTDLTILMTNKLANVNSQSIVQSHASLDSFIYSFKVEIPTAEVLQLNSTPKLLVAAPGLGYAIECLSFSVKITTYGGVPYDTNIAIQAITDTATNPQLSSYLDSTVARWVSGHTLLLGSTTDTVLINNKGLYAKVFSGNPLNGNSDIIVYGIYRIIAI